MVDIEQFVQGNAAFIPLVVAFWAADRGIQGELPFLVGILSTPFLEQGRAARRRAFCLLINQAIFTDQGISFFVGHSSCLFAIIT